MNARYRLGRSIVATLVIALAACAREQTSAPDVLVLYNAGSLTRPLRTAFDSFATRAPVTLAQENAGSLETARKLTDLHKIPDVIALADYEVFPEILMPQEVSWYADFARNRMVIAYTPRSRFASEIDSSNWWQILQRPGVQVGRSDPNLDPNGYRTLLTMQLAERFYHQPGLSDHLLAAAPPRNMRPKEADLVGILQAGELDYIWSYESLADAAGLHYVHLPPEIDLSSPSDSAFYAQAVVRIIGKTPHDTITARGQPIVYALSIPKQAPHPELAARFVAFLLSPDGRRVLHAARLDALDAPLIIGTGAPASVVAAARSR